ncbi:uncharacterized protein LOC133174571 [Saccostrea echinata]|uniref:uncharacterized protein LOC133174571 n=1 Tax=Saccostrea echinata TaxID=191078 RepID=UPI002A8179E4|nr:uncharacterized protein LOC133174571 [Saccostrea echinata]
MEKPSLSFFIMCFSCFKNVEYGNCLLFHNPDNSTTTDHNSVLTDSATIHHLPEKQISSLENTVRLLTEKVLSPERNKSTAENEIADLKQRLRTTEKQNAVLSQKFTSLEDNYENKDINKTIKQIFSDIRQGRLVSQNFVKLESSVLDMQNHVGFTARATRSNSWTGSTLVFNTLIYSTVVVMIRPQFTIDMATAQGQDFICCQLCPNPVEHHCNLCNVDLCLSCIPNHMADKSKKHEVVAYTSREENTFILPTCSLHNKNRCEMFCRSCEEAICIQCLMGSHKNHEYVDITEILQNIKKQILADTKDLETTIVPKYIHTEEKTVDAEFDKVISDIEIHEEKICQAVSEVCIQLKAEITKQKEEAVKRSEEDLEEIVKTEEEVKQIIQKNKYILRSNDSSAIINYQSRNKDFRTGPEFLRPCNEILPDCVEQGLIVSMFGFLKFGNDSMRQPRMLKMMDNPKLISTIQTPYDKDNPLLKLHCAGRYRIITSGREKKIRLIDTSKSISQTIHINGIVSALTSNLQEEPVFILTKIREFGKVYIYQKNKAKSLLEIPNWDFVGLCYTVYADLLASMRSRDKMQSRVIRYSEPKVIQSMQYDCKRQPLFSTGSLSPLRLTENGNGDICVADTAGKAVVVMNFCGRLRFRYRGNLSKQSNYTEFSPVKIASDVHNQILICDRSNNIVHITDCDGNFVRYIEYPCNGGISIDTDHNLVLGDSNSGKIQFIKYLE